MSRKSNSQISRGTRRQQKPKHKWGQPLDLPDLPVSPRNNQSFRLLLTQEQVNQITEPTNEGKHR